MKKLIKASKRRIKSRSGESITEVLVALLVSTLGIVLLAGMINSSSIMINQSKDKITEFVRESKTVVEQKDDPAYGTDTVEIVENNVSIKLFDGDKGASIEYFENDAAGKTVVKSYKVK